MGWTFTRDATRADIVAERVEAWSNDTHAGQTTRHCLKGNVLWTVWSIIDKRNHRIERYIGCDLLQSERGYGWGYKDMCESMDPYYYSCPLDYLTIVPVACEAWRERVREYHARQKRRLRVGATYTLVGRTIPHVEIVRLRPLIGRYNGRTYRVSKPYIGDEVLEGRSCPQGTQ
jgi:hypothetical protein